MPSGFIDPGPKAQPPASQFATHSSLTSASGFEAAIVSQTTRTGVGLSGLSSPRKARSVARVLCALATTSLELIVSSNKLKSGSSAASFISLIATFKSQLARKAATVVLAVACSS